MKKLILICGTIAAFLIAFSSLATPTSMFPIQTQEPTACQASPNHTSPSFCTGFYTTVMCNCGENPLYTEQQCEQKGMKWIYTQMIGLYKSLTTACEANQEKYNTTVAECVAQWNCYEFGGKGCQGKTSAPQCPKQ